MKVIPINFKGNVNAYILKGKKSVIVDTGSPNNVKKIIESLERENIPFSYVSLILITHGHADHFGSVKLLKKEINAPVAVHRLDSSYLEKGINPPITPIKTLGKIIKPFLNQKADGCKPDLVINDEFDLRDYGVDAKIIYTPGHTEGSISIITNNKEAIIGDLLMGGYLGGAINKTRPAYHYFIDNMSDANRSIDRLLSEKVDKFHVGHGGPLKRKDVVELNRKN